ncbi:MAG: acyltransferase [candidate division WOR-3 bacterium]|nr:acyltransferase [candidate division WOR-3 bacterium]
MRIENSWSIQSDKAGERFEPMPGDSGQTDMRLLRKLCIILSVSMRSCSETLFSSLPNYGAFPRFRVWYWRKRGYAFAKRCYIARDVYFLGKVSMGEGSSISNNCMFNGGKVGITIGKKVMIAPNCVLAAFSHGYSDLEKPMIDQPVVEAPVVIEDDVWIAANCTIAKGVRLGHGCIVGSNSVVTRDVEPYSIVGGVPAIVIGTRKSKAKEAVA